MSNCLYGINKLKKSMLELIKMDTDCYKYSSECITYKISKEQMDKDLSIYEGKKGFIKR